ncbi:uncharacterized protein LOC100899304 [Galendromus occidentalis]|uniref:Uncharacterized protein LOC100899304 n=1 Tax=Galendromus occidentalis TaxID=34638 RepID=A0AAJ6QMD3_9ACAR|nr:uncharacterized protein LOC100899304 [Galendromus occidentalis]
MGSVNTSVSLRLPPGAGSKRVVSTSTNSAAAASATNASSVSINRSNSISVSGRLVADHHDYHLQHHPQLRVNGDAGSGLNGGVGGGLKPLTNGRGTFTLVKRGGVISNGGKMVTTSTNGGSNNALNENSHVREIYTSPTLFNGVGGTATVTAIVPTTTRLTSHPTATSSSSPTTTFSAFSSSNNNNNNRLKSNQNSGIPSKNNTTATSNNNQTNHDGASYGQSPAGRAAATGVMLPPNQKLAGSKTTIIIGRNSQQYQEINGNHNYSMRDIANASAIANNSKPNSIGASSNSPTPMLAIATATTTMPKVSAASASGTIPAPSPMRVSTPLTKKISAAGAVTRNTMSTTEDEEEDDDANGAATSSIPSRQRLSPHAPCARVTAGSTLLSASSIASSSSSSTRAPTATASTITNSPAAAGASTTTTTAAASTSSRTAFSTGTSVRTHHVERSRFTSETNDEHEIAKRKDELPSGSECAGRFSADPAHMFAVDCEAQLRKMHELNRKNDVVSQRIHRIQTKSTVEVAYSELKQVIAQGQEIFKMPCLMSKSGQIAAQLANKEKNTTPLQRKLGENDSAKLVRGCGIHSTLIANTEKLCDSSATESSSEEEDLPEKVEIFNGRRILTPFQYASSHSSCRSQHPAWRWASERATLGAQWTWLQAQVSELEYRIRQQHELCRQLRLRKEPCLQQPDPNNSDDMSRCARTTPLNKNFTKRRLVHAHTIPAEVAESVPIDALNLSCECGTMYPQIELCVRCTFLHAQSARERLDISEERQQEEFQLTRQLMAIPLWDSQSEVSRMATYDETYHPVLSGKHDISLSLHYENLLRMGYSLLVHKNAQAESSSDAAVATTSAASGAAAVAAKKKRDLQAAGTQAQQQASQHSQQRSAAATPEPPEIDDDAPPTKRKRPLTHAANRPSRSEKRGSSGGAPRPTDGVSKKRRADRRFTTAPAHRSVSVDSQEQADDELFADIGDRNNPSRTRRTSNVVHQEYGYDIDNIVIPYGMMSSTRLVEPLKYKEILTPKWRILHLGPVESEDNEQSAQVEGSATVSDKMAAPESGKSSFAMDDEDTVLAVKDDGKEEDTSDAAFEVRHSRQETLERERFSAYLQPKLVSNIGSPSAAIYRGRRTESTDAQKSKDSSTQAATPQMFPSAMRAKEIHDESSLLGSEVGGKTESIAKLHASKAKRQHRSLSQDWTMQQSSSAPTPYPPRKFPLSDEEFEKILQENSDPDEVEKACETVPVDESNGQKPKEKPRRFISKSNASSSPSTGGQTPLTEQKQDDPLSSSKAFPDELQQGQRQRVHPAAEEEPQSQERPMDLDEPQARLSRRANEVSKTDAFSLGVEDAESLDVEDNSDVRVASKKSEQNEDFEMHDDNSNPSNHGLMHWLNVSCDKVNEADILDEIANPEWSADEEEETEPEED